jgi:hypothetical protein
MFKKKAGLGVVSLPGLPGLGNDTIVEGDEYAKFCPAVLEEVFDAPAKPVPKPAQKPAPATKPPAPLPQPPEPEEGDEGEEEPEPPSMGWRKDELVEYAEGLGLTVDGMTKREILAAIEDEEGE